ncbi:5-hydroxytryptamine (serotonin) receptor 1A, G protein-coupled [Cichlidogyrus casuarinus]|uniref:5-hydroxytryptamine (Serotonin) receptor 1A, G protein-coupled n=1 Tax=Cichlidogyrus casuarinus TaxID=1844966 RepID=A0ABD2QB42_9PLAT
MTGFNYSPSNWSSDSSSIHNTTTFTSGFEARYGNNVHLVLVSILLSVIILCTIIGNVFVVAAILLEKNLQGRKIRLTLYIAYILLRFFYGTFIWQRVSNYLILSLAMADLLVATLVLPLTAIQTVSKRWWLAITPTSTFLLISGMEICDFLVITDVLCCTSSTLHLVAIAVDRYFAVTSVDYIRRRTMTPIMCMIAAIWISSCAVGVPARFFAGRMDKLYNETLVEGICSVNQEAWFTVIATGVTFFIPMVLMIAIYARIYVAARGRIRKKRFTKGTGLMIMKSAVALKDQNMKLPMAKNTLIERQTVQPETVKVYTLKKPVQTEYHDREQRPLPVPAKLKSLTGPTLQIQSCRELTLSDSSLDSHLNNSEPMSLNLNDDLMDLQQLRIKGSLVKSQFQLESCENGPWVYDEKVKDQYSKPEPIDLSKVIPLDNDPEKIPNGHLVQFVPNICTREQLPNKDRGGRLNVTLSFLA